MTRDRNTALGTSTGMPGASTAPEHHYLKSQMLPCYKLDRDSEHVAELKQNITGTCSMFLRRFLLLEGYLP